MYLEHFALRELPFTLTPNTQYFVNMASYHKAYNLLMVSIDNHEGFIKMVGEVGTGKTMLCRKVLNALEEEPERYVTAYIANPVLSPKGLFLAFAEELGLECVPDDGHHSVLKKITRQLMQHAAENKQVILFIDEAHAMPPQKLEALRLLTNIETETTKLFQVVLFAQPELDEMLREKSLRQLLQRITFSFRLETLSREEMERYINHRLTTAGHNGAAIFSRRALDSMYDASGGIPRLVNILSHKAMMAAYGKGDLSVDVEHVKSAVDDTEGVSLAPPSSSRSMLAAGLGVVVGVGALVYVLAYYL